MSGRLRMKLMGLTTFINVVIGVSLGGLLYTIWPSHYYEWYPSIPVFYWLSSMLMIFFSGSCKTETRRCHGGYLYGSPAMQVHARFGFPLVICQIGRTKPESLWLYDDVVLFHLSCAGNIYIVSV